MFIVQFDNHDRDESFWDPATERQSSDYPAHRIPKEEEKAPEKTDHQFGNKKSKRRRSGQEVEE